MAARKPEPTKAERKYLKVMERLKQEGAAFSHPAMCQRLGYSSVSSSWETYSRLLEKGLILPAGTQLVSWPQPSLTPKAKKFLKAA